MTAQFVKQWSSYAIKASGYLLPVILLGSWTSVLAITHAPVLISESTSTRAVALESVVMKPGPFPVTASVGFAADSRTRVVLYAMNLELLVGEGASAFTADAEDASHNHYSLTVEYVGQVPSFEGISMIVLRLNDAMGDLGDVLVRLNLHGVSSNRVRLAVGHVGGGLPDDQGAEPTPAPPIPPAPATPLTIAQYQAQFSNPSFSSDQDIRRFLEQATWGPRGDGSDLQHIRNVGMQSFLDEQFQQPISEYPSLTLYPFDFGDGCAPNLSATCGSANYSMYPLQTRFFQRSLSGSDQLRQRLAFSLHKLIVVSGNTIIWPSYIGPYFRTLDQDAFGSYRTILYDMTLNPAMGFYLSTAGNSQAAPNENYAREVMQLFSIGVDLLNQDGTPVLDAQGNRVPTYDQATITNLARVFTGWDLKSYFPWSANPNVYVPDFISPMVLQNNRNTYDIAQKTLLTDIKHATPLVLPACTNCTNLANAQFYKNSELNAAIDNLFNHPNVGPYLCTQLIHQFVTSNPSPPYVGRCSAAFANNGSGVRGDMKAVITSILLDPEARGEVKNDPNYGHLREPVLFTNNLLRAFNATSDYNLSGSWTTQNFLIDLGQDLFNPDTVFGYFPADFQLPGTSNYGPEFGSLSSASVFKRANFVSSLVAFNGNGILPSGSERPTGTQLNYSSYQAMSGNPAQMIDALDALLMHNTMSPSMKNTIVTTVANIPSNSPALRTQTAIYLIATSAQYQVER